MIVIIIITSFNELLSLHIHYFFHGQWIKLSTDMKSYPMGKFMMTACYTEVWLTNIATGADILAKYVHFRRS